MEGSVASRRLAREVSKMRDEPIAGLTLLSTSEDLSEWKLKIEGAAGTIYAGECYTLQMKFTPNYPIDNPEVQFVGPENPPVHPHVYTNGHICLSILYDEWSPVQTVKSICLSIISMLSSCKEKKLPEDNQRYVMFAPKSSKRTRWAFHDDKV